MEDISENKSWIEISKSFLKPSVIAILFLGFAAGIPILLIFSSLSLWLREAGVERSAVTFFSWAALGYSFKFVWAPLVDRLPLPILTRLLGRRKSWLLLSQVFIILGILGMAFTDPSKAASNLTVMAIFAVILGFSSATQDIVIDAFRIESDTKEMQGILSSTYIAGYRIAMIVSGAGALFLASFLGSTKDHYSYKAWMWTYVAMAFTMLIGVLTTLFIKEPQINRSNESQYTTRDYTRFFVLFLIAAVSFAATFFYSSEVSEVIKTTLSGFLGGPVSKFLVETLRLGAGGVVAFVVIKTLMGFKFVNSGMIEETYVSPVKDFFQRYGSSVAFLLLALVGFYRISDIVLGIISNVFYQDLGFSKNEIASVVKTFGVFMTLLGGFVGGVVTLRYGVMKTLFAGAVLSAGTNLLFMLLANIGNNLPMLYLVISADNLAAGIASAAFVAFLSSLTNISFTAVQYALFTSLMTLFPKLLGGYSGAMVDSLGYSGFFITTTLMGVPVLYLVWLAGKKLEIQDNIKSPKKAKADKQNQLEAKTLKT